jgi:hypothetical protein
MALLEPAQIVAALHRDGKFLCAVLQTSLDCALEVVETRRRSWKALRFYRHTPE